MDPPVQVDFFFRTLGRSYGIVSGLALVVALAGGGILLAGRKWDGLMLVAAGLAAGLMISTRVDGLGSDDFDRSVGEAMELCPIGHLFAGAEVSVDAELEAT